MAVMKDFTISYQSSPNNIRHKVKQYAIQYTRGPTPLAILWPTGTNLVYGEPVSASTLTGGIAETLWGLPVAGEFQWVDDTEVLDAGAQTPAVVFIPEDDRKYESPEGVADLTVEQRAINVTADPVSKVYGTFADPALTYEYTGELQGSDSFSGALTREAGEVAGAYEISQGTLTLGSNYSINFTLDFFTVEQASPEPIVWPTTNAIDEGQTLASATWATSGGAAVDGTFQWVNSGVSPVHSVEHQAQFVPDDPNYQTISTGIYVRVWRTSTTSWYAVANGSNIGLSTAGWTVVNASITWRGKRAAGPHMSQSNYHESGWLSSGTTFNSNVVHAPAIPADSVYVSQGATTRALIEWTAGRTWQNLSNDPSGAGWSGIGDISSGGTPGSSTWSWHRTRSSSLGASSGTGSIRINGGWFKGRFTMRTTYYTWVHTADVSTSMVPHNGSYGDTIGHNVTTARQISLPSDNSNFNVSIAIGGSTQADVKFDITYYTTE